MAEVKGFTPWLGSAIPYNDVVEHDIVGIMVAGIG